MFSSSSSSIRSRSSREKEPAAKMTANDQKPPALPSPSFRLFGQNNNNNQHSGITGNHHIKSVPLSGSKPRANSDFSMNMPIRRPSIPSSIRPIFNRRHTMPTAKDQSEDEDLMSNASSNVSELTLMTGDGKVTWYDAYGNFNYTNDLNDGLLEHAKSKEWRLKRQGQLKGTLAVSFSSTATAKHSNSNRKRNPRTGNSSNCSTATGESNENDESQKTDEGTGAGGGGGGGTEKMINVDEVIKLKLMVANQQATIDILGSTQRNLEFAVVDKIRGLEEQIRNLQDQLSECQMREQSLKEELAVHRNAAAADCPNNGSRHQQQRQQYDPQELEMLENQNRELMKENQKLWHVISKTQNPIVVGQRRTT